MSASQHSNRDRVDLNHRSARRYLRTSAAEIHRAAAETQEEIDGMARLVTSLTEHVVGMSLHLDKLEETSLKPQDMKAVRDDVASLDAVSNKTISRLQFAERLNRRLHRVQKNLSALDCLLAEDASEHPNGKLKPDLSLAQQRRLFAEIVADAKPSVAPRDNHAGNVTWLALNRPRE